MKLSLITTAALISLSAPAFAADVAAGEKDFKKCKSCHEIVADDGTAIVKGGKTGPNLYGVIGRQAGSVEGFKYGETIVAAGEGGLVWDEENLVAYTADPKSFLADVTGDDKAKSKMTFKLAKGADNIAAYLASVAPATN
jgi:cytochrome c